MVVPSNSQPRSKPSVGKLPARGTERDAIKIVSWNVNSIRARLEHVTAWLRTHEPDVLLLQELKGYGISVQPHFKELGYECRGHAKKAYGGVADPLSRHPIGTISKNPCRRRGG